MDMRRPATEIFTLSSTTPSATPPKREMKSGSDVSTWNLCGYGCSPFALRAKTLLMRFAVYCVASSSPSSSSSDFLESALGAAAAFAAFAASFSAFALAFCAALRRFLYSLSSVARGRRASSCVGASEEGGGWARTGRDGRDGERSIGSKQERRSIANRSARGGGSHLLLMGSPGNSGYSLSAGASVWAGSAIVSACVVRRWGVACVRRRVRSPRRRRENPAV